MVEWVEWVMTNTTLVCLDKSFDCCVFVPSGELQRETRGQIWENELDGDEAGSGGSRSEIFILYGSNSSGQVTIYVLVLVM